VAGASFPNDIDPGIFRFFRRKNNGNSNYNSLQASLEKRFSSGLQFQAAYTFSKSFDQASSFEGELNPLDFNGTYSLSQFDARHRFIFSYFWALPVPRYSGFAGKILNGWDLSGIYSFQTGFPITISQTSDATTAFEGSQRPIRILGVDPGTPGRIQDRLGAGLSPANPQLGLASNVYLNKNAFMSVTDFNNLNGFTLTTSPYPFGNMARNIAEIRTAGAKLVNASFGKSTNITEGVRLEFRVEASNTLNTPRFSGPNTNINSPQFGQITSQGGFQRQVKWLARVHF